MDMDKRHGQGIRQRHKRLGDAHLHCVLWDRSAAWMYVYSSEGLKRQ